MVAFWIAVGIGAVVGVVYLALVADAFTRSRREFVAGAPADVAGDPDGPEVYEQQGRNFGWMALGGVVVSTTLLVGASIASWTWYILPFLGIGSAIAVIVAFVIDRREVAA
jgi:hypothetical protein